MIFAMDTTIPLCLIGRASMIARSIASYCFVNVGVQFQLRGNSQFGVNLVVRKSYCLGFLVYH